MSRFQRLYSGLAAICGLALLVSGLAADDHHDGSAKLGAKLKTNGTHQIHTVANHKINATANGGKVQSMHALNPKNEKVNPSKHVKSKQKRHAAGVQPNGDVHYVMANVDAAEDDGCQDGVQWIGFVFTIGNQTFIYWFPVAEVAPAIINITVNY